MLQLRGVFAPVTTPFDSSGELDAEGLQRNLHRLASSGVTGIVLFGSTGEGVLLDESERRKGLSAAREAMGDHLVLAAAGAESTRTAIRLAQSAAEAGASAVLVPPPAYYRPQMTSEALREHYLALADAAPVPVILYQVPPVYSGIELQAGLVATLARHPNIAGIKDSTGDLKGLGQLVEQCPADFAVLVGSGAALYPALEIGSPGGILAVADLVPEWCCEVVRLKQLGEDRRAGSIQERLTSLHRGIVATYGVPGVKAALDFLGQAGGAPRSPLRPLGERDRSKVREVLESVGALSVGNGGRSNVI